MVSRSVALVRKFEGCRLTPYLDVAGIPTIGYGAIYNLNGLRVKITDPAITQEVADEMLARDVSHAYSAVVRLCPVRGLSDGKLAALTDFTFNLGSGTLQHSTLRSMVLQGDLSLAAEQFRLYCHAGGRVVPGLLRRREAEIGVWNEV